MMSEELTVTWPRSIKVWWAVAWRGFLFGGLAGMVVGFIMGLVGLVRYAALAGVIVGLPIGVWAFKRVLQLSFSDFRIALISTNNSPPEEA